LLEQHICHDEENLLWYEEDLIRLGQHFLCDEERLLRDADHLHDDGNYGRGRTENGVVRVDQRRFKTPEGVS
jgi:hypothetical protein